MYIIVDVYIYIYVYIYIKHTYILQTWDTKAVGRGQGPV